MLQTKIFLSDENGEPSSFCMAEDYFNAQVAENSNVVIKDVKYQHVMTEESDYVKQSSSIMVLFEVPESLEPHSRFTWHSVWDQRFLFAQEMQDKDWCLNKCKEEPTFPLQLFLQLGHYLKYTRLFWLKQLMVGMRYL